MLISDESVPLGEQFRQAFRHHPTGVAVITAMAPTEEGEPEPVGITASSVASVAAAPAALSFSVSGARSARRLIAAPTVVVHLMQAEQLEAVKAFATPGADRFADGTWSTLLTGEPLLNGTPWALRCAIIERIEVGESVLVAAEVLEILRPAAVAAAASDIAGEHDAVGDSQEIGTPLVYFNRSFHTSSPL